MTLRAQGSLVRATVYREGAICVRRVAIAAGTTIRRVTVTGLPLTLLPGSVRVRVPNGASNMPFDVHATFDASAFDVFDPPLSVRERDQAKRRLAMLERSVGLLERQVVELSGLRPMPTPPAEGASARMLDVGASLALATFVDVRCRDLASQILSLRREMDVAKRDLDLREQCVSDASGVDAHKVEVTRAVVVAFAQDAVAPFDLEIEYVLPAVRWMPRYALSINGNFTRGSLRMQALVSQASGEDWTRVELSLSTAALFAEADLPTLRSLRIGRSQPDAMPPGFRSPPSGLEELFEDYDRARPSPPSTPTETWGVPDALSAMLGPANDRPAGDRTRLGAPPSRSAPPAAPTMGSVAEASDEGWGRAYGRPPPPSPPPRLRTPAPPPPMAASAAFDQGWDRTAVAARPPPAYGVAPSVDAPTLARALWDYDSLRVAGPDEGSRRGKLRLAAFGEAIAGARPGLPADKAAQIISRRILDCGAVDATPSARYRPVADVERFDFQYDCAAPADVPAGGAWCTVNVLEVDLPLSLQYVCVPGVTPQVFRSMVVVNDTNNALLGGPLDVSIGDTFLLSTSLPATVPGARTERIGLGVEEAVKVARSAQFFETGAGLFGGATQLKHEISIDLVNRLPVPIAIEVRERIPVPAPSEKDIKVEETQVDPAWEPVDGPLDGEVVQGARIWRISLGPTAHQTLTAQFLIRIPNDRTLVGGNRQG